MYCQLKYLHFTLAHLKGQGHEYFTDSVNISQMVADRANVTTASK